MSKRTVIFDCDGVLVDSEDVIIRTKATVLSTHGVNVPIERAFELFTGQTNEATVQIAEQLSGIKLSPNLAATMSDAIFSAMLIAPLKPMPGALEALKTLRSMGIALGVASNGKLKKTQMNLDRAGLSEYFGDNVLSREHVGLGKPAPDVYLYAAEAMNATHEDCIVVEDSMPGVLSAKAAGMIAIGYIPKGDIWGLGSEVSSLIAHLSELSGLMDAWNGARS